MVYVVLDAVAVVVVGDVVVVVHVGLFGCPSDEFSRMFDWGL